MRALLFLLKGAKETRRVFRFGLHSSWSPELEVLAHVWATSGYANIRSQEILGGRRACNLTVKSE